MELKNAQGNPVEPFIKDGTTYIPVRAVATALGCEVGWNGDTNTVTIDKKAENAALSITTPATEISTEVGKKLEIKATAKGGTEPYKYMWCKQQIKKNNVGWLILSNSSEPKLEITPTAAGEYKYRCVVQDASGATAVTRIITVTVVEEPIKITLQPSDMTVYPGNPFTFIIHVSGGTAPYTYKWEYRAPDSNVWAEIPVNENTVTGFRNLSQTGYEFRCTVTDSNGNCIVSNIAKANIAMQITSQNPQSVYCKQDSMQQLYVSVDGGKKPLTYQWYYSSPANHSFTQVVDALPWANGSRSSKLDVKFIEAGYLFYCEVTDAEGKTLKSNIVGLFSDDVLRIVTENFGSSVQDKETANANDDAIVRITAAGGTAPYTLTPQISSDNKSWVDVNNKSVTYQNGSSMEVKKPYDIGSGSKVYYRIKVADSKGNAVYTRSIYLTIK